MLWLLFWFSFVSSIVNSTVYVPSFRYMWVGFFSVEFVWSPKFHSHETISFEVFEVSVNVTIKGDVPFVGVAVKLASPS